MGTEVLRPQDCLNHPFALPRRRCSVPPGNRPRSGSQKPADPPFHQKRQQPSRRGTDEIPLAGKPPGRKATAKNLTMGQVSILKRGQSLDCIKGGGACDPPTSAPTNKSLAGEFIVSTTDRLGPDPSFIPRQIGLTAATLPGLVYAGSAFSLSPAPSSLPLPTFSVNALFGWRVRERKGGEGLKGKEWKGMGRKMKRGGKGEGRKGEEMNNS